MNKTQQTPEDMPLSPEEIKAIGEIELGPAKHEVFLNKHYKKLIFGGIALAIVATAATAWYAHTEQKVEDAGSLIVKGVGSTAIESTLSPQNYDAAAFDAIVADFQGTPSVETAQLLKSIREITDPAVTDFSTLCNLADKAENDMVRTRAAVALAMRFTKDGDTEKATLYWKKVINMPRNVYTARAYVNLCDLAWNAGKAEQAAEYLRMGRASCPDSPLFMQGANNDIAVRSDLLESGVDAPVVTEAIFAKPIETTPAAPSQSTDLGLPSDMPAIPEAPTTTLPDLSMPSTLPAGN